MRQRVCIAKARGDKARALIAENFQIDASGGYLSFGQNGLDVWEGKLQLSYGF